MIDISDNIFFDQYNEECSEKPVHISLHGSPDLHRPPPSTDDLILPSQRSVTSTQIDRLFGDSVTQSQDNFQRHQTSSDVFSSKGLFEEHGTPPLFDSEDGFTSTQSRRDLLRKELFPDPEDTFAVPSQQPARSNTTVKRRRLFRPPIKASSQQAPHKSSSGTFSLQVSESIRSGNDNSKPSSSQRSAGNISTPALRDEPPEPSQASTSQHVAMSQTGSNRSSLELDPGTYVNTRGQQSSFFTSARTVLDSPSPLTIPGYVTPGGSRGDVTKLRPITEVPEKYRSIFNAYPYFNIVQSKVMDDVLYSDKPLVLCAPTGSGKTVIFELAIVRLLLQVGSFSLNQVKIVYMAPIKALCSERCDDWQQKFGAVGLKCKELTGDSQWDDYFELQDTNIIMTTPEKWDSMTRKWRDNKSLVQMVKLFLIDEVHTLNDEARGATMEAVISRMKTVQSSQTDNTTSVLKSSKLRFIAISATIPNITDVGEWLGEINEAAITYKLDDTHRPVRLRKVVLGFPCRENVSEFKFDLSLNYKLSGVIQTYSEQKPTLVFCATRKGVQQAASTLVKDARFIMNSQHRQRLQRNANMLRDSKLRELVVNGVGYHHAGLDVSDRKTIENMFLRGDLPVLLATSTLAMGVNLPAHLVVVKSTLHYVSGMYTEYTETQVLQMIGRAGRPQFDTTATAVIMTRTKTKDRYEALLNGTQNIESSLHVHIMEHLNAEIVLHTITDMNIALEWLKSTFLYIRVVKNPTYYGIPPGLSKEALEKRLTDMCGKYLRSLTEIDLVKIEDPKSVLHPTELGKLMARYCIAYDTMKLFKTISGQASLNELILLLSKCKEFTDVQLRVNEKRTLNTLNSSKNKATIRFSMTGKIKTADMKVNCLIQAAFGCLSVQEFALAQDTTKIFRAGQRVTRCLTEYLMQEKGFRALVNAVTLSKCFKARLWENSGYVARQLERIGPTLTQAMVNAGLTSFKRIEETNPREIELIVNRHPPFGNQIHDAVCHLPQYDIAVTQSSKYSAESADITLSVFLVNWETIQVKNTAGPNHCIVLIVGDADNNVHYKMRISDTILCKNGTWSKRIEVQRGKKGDELSIHLISQDFVGLDVQKTFIPSYQRRYGGNYDEKPRGKWKIEHSPTVTNRQPGPNDKSTRIPCNHRCINKAVCGHECCQFGVKSNKARNKPVNAVEPRKEAPFHSYVSQLHAKMQHMPETPSLKRLKVSPNQDNASTPQIPTDSSPYFYESPYGSKVYTQHKMVDKFAEEDWGDDDLMFDDYFNYDVPSKPKPTDKSEVIDLCHSDNDQTAVTDPWEDVDWGQDDEDFLLDCNNAGMWQEGSNKYISSGNNHDEDDFEDNYQETPLSKMGLHNPIKQKPKFSSYKAGSEVSRQISKPSVGQQGKISAFFTKQLPVQNQGTADIRKPAQFQQQDPPKTFRSFQFKRKYNLSPPEKENYESLDEVDSADGCRKKNLTSDVKSSLQNRLLQTRQQPEEQTTAIDAKKPMENVVSNLRNKFSFKKTRYPALKATPSNTTDMMEPKERSDCRVPALSSPELCIQEPTGNRKHIINEVPEETEKHGFGSPQLLHANNVGKNPPSKDQHSRVPVTGMNFFTVASKSQDTSCSGASQDFLNIFDGIF